MPYKDPTRQRAYQRQWLAQRRAEWFAENGPCVECGTWENLELDHVDGSTKVSHSVWSWAPARRAVELAKCVARCEFCHKEKSKTEVLRGIDVSCSKLIPEQVVEIRARFALGETLRGLAIEFGVHNTTVSQIVLYKNWTHV